MELMTIFEQVVESMPLDYMHSCKESGGISVSHCGGISVSVGEMVDRGIGSKIIDIYLYLYGINRESIVTS